jgi:hypothetical protein
MRAISSRMALLPRSEKRRRISLTEMLGMGTAIVNQSMK